MRFLILFSLVSSVAFATPNTPAYRPLPEPHVVLAIVDALDALVGDTVDEGSCNADVIRDEAGNPSRTVCRVTTIDRKHSKYSCDITFLVTPYEGEDLGTEPWETTCYDVIYTVQPLRGKRPIIERNEDSAQRCLESLSEGP